MSRRVFLYRSLMLGTAATAFALSGCARYGMAPAASETAQARALVTEPKLLLLDEPMSNLDAALRASLRGELKLIQKELDQTVLYVTHDQIEAMSMGDKIGVLNHGRLVQTGTPNDIYNNPKSSEENDEQKHRRHQQRQLPQQLRADGRGLERLAGGHADDGNGRHAGHAQALRHVPARPRSERQRPAAGRAQHRLRP